MVKMSDNSPDCSNRGGDSFPVAEVAIGELSPPHKSEFPTWAALPFFFGSSQFSHGQPPFANQPWQRHPWLMAPPWPSQGEWHGFLQPTLAGSESLRWAIVAAAPGCHYWSVRHVAISATERNDSSQEKALAEVINERFRVFLENHSISGMTWNIY